MKKLLNFYAFKVRLEDGTVKSYGIYSKHLNGAVRKLYQQYDIEDVLEIL